MCGGTPKVERRDIAAEQRQAEADATKEANAEIAYRKRQRRKSSLIANPGGASGLGASAISTTTGSDTLG